MTKQKPKPYVPGTVDGNPLLLPHRAGEEPMFSAYEVIDAFFPAYWSAEWVSTGKDLTRAWVVNVYPKCSSVHMFESYLRAASRIFHFGVQRQMVLDAETLLADRTINAFIVEGLGDVTSRTRQAYRMLLRNLAKATLRKTPRWRPDPKWSAATIVPPYSAEDIASMWVAADGQSTERLRRFMTAWVGLALGAGLRNVETRSITGAHFSRRSGVVLVDVPGARERKVPVRREVMPRLRPLIDAFPDEPLAGPFRPDQRDPMGVSRARLKIPAWVPAAETERFRSSWIITLIDEGVPLQRILQYAGQSTFRFDTTVAYLSDRKDMVDADLRRAAGYTA